MYKVYADHSILVRAVVIVILVSNITPLAIVRQRVHFAVLQQLSPEGLPSKGKLLARQDSHRWREYFRH